MSKYSSIVPEDIASNSFDFHGVSIEIETDSDAPGNEYQPKWGFFAKGHYGVTNTNPPPLCRNQIEYTAYSRSI